MRFVLVIETGADRAGPAFSIGQAAPVATPTPAPGPAAPSVSIDPPPAPSSPPTPVADTLIEQGWTKLVEAQQRMTTELGKDAGKDQDRFMWIGGAMSMFALLAGEDETEVGRRLGAEVPTPTWKGIPVKPAHETKQATPHAGAQRTVTEDDAPLEPDPGLAAYVTDAPTVGEAEPTDA